MYKILGSDQKEYGPVTPEQLRQWIVERRLHAQSLVRLDGAPNWTPLAQFPEFSATLAGAGPVSPAAAPVATRTNPMAVIALVTSIIATPAMCCCGFVSLGIGLPIVGIPFNMLGIILSFVALNQIKKNPETERGKGLAIAAIILSSLSLVFSLIPLIFGFANVFGDFLKK